jgi:molybdopterin-guanine dinucleotide biosynthesis protein
MRTEGGPRNKDLQRIRAAAWAFATRRVPVDAADHLLPLVGKPETGDLILAVVDFVGQHTGLQLPSGRRMQMFPGAEIVVAYGNRYASNQFESEVPQTLGPCHLSAGGGIASRVTSWHARMKSPTQITPIGLLGNDRGGRINLRDYALPTLANIGSQPPTTIAVVGTGMDSGKTHSCAHFVRGLIAAGLKVAFIKITGTGAGGDTWLLRDAGASPVLDFTDAGMSTTYLAPISQIESALVSLLAHAANEGVDAAVVEIADGVLQIETSALLKSKVFASLVSGLMMVSHDSMGASAGVHWLMKNSPPPVLALSGIVSASPLQAREATQALGLPVYDYPGLASARNALEILAGAQRHRETLHGTGSSQPIRHADTRGNTDGKEHHDHADQIIQPWMATAPGTTPSPGAAQ